MPGIFSRWQQCRAIPALNNWSPPLGLCLQVYRRNHEENQKSFKNPPLRAHVEAFRCVRTIARDKWHVERRNSGSAVNCFHVAIAINNGKVFSTARLVWNHFGLLAGKEFSRSWKVFSWKMWAYSFFRREIIKNMPKILDTLVSGSKFGLNNSRLVKNIPAMLARDVMWKNVLKQKFCLFCSWVKLLLNFLMKKQQKLPKK